jgi:hypothetical protein
MRGETLFKEALEIKLNDPNVKGSKVDKYLQEQLQKKSAKLQEAVPIYSDVITRFNSPKWGLASMTRMGMMFDDVAHQIETAPTPPGLPEEVELAYVEQLLDFSGQFEEKAIGFYVAAVKKAADTGWFSSYTTEAQKRLFDLRPMEYRSASEVKATPNKMVAKYHAGALYTDLEELRGNSTKEERVFVSDESLGEGTSESEAPADAQ